MKYFVSIVLFISLLVFNKVNFAQSFTYTSPTNNAAFVALNSNLIFHSDNAIELSGFSAQDFSITGNKSGIHNGKIVLAENGHTLLFYPTSPFQADEQVSVVTPNTIKTTDGYPLSPISLQFQTTAVSAQSSKELLLRLGTTATTATASSSAALYKTSSALSTLDTVPANFPPLTITTSNGPSDGKLFYSNNTFTPTATNYGHFATIANNDGSIAKYIETATQTMDLKVQPNGLLSYAQLLNAMIINQSDLMITVRWYIADSTFTTIDSVQCGNGYAQYTDVHDFLVLPNGHYVLFAFDPEPVDMSKYGGSPSAIVMGAIIQELDANKNVVFQWRSWDSLPLDASYMDLTTNTVDLIHGNALSVDADGNILFSMRHLSSVIKINRQTGNLMWTLGGKYNQFSFPNEHQANAPTYFSFQHDIKVLPSGNITLFDNGNQHPTASSRAVEYKLDEQAKTADLVWEYSHSPAIFASAMGSVERLQNGNSMIGWGYASLLGSPAFTEIKSDGTVVLEGYLPNGQLSYRFRKEPWGSATQAGSVFNEVLAGNTYHFTSTNDTTGITIKFNDLNSSLYADVFATKYNYSPLTPTFAGDAPILVSNYFNLRELGIYSYSGTVDINLANYPLITNPSSTIIYTRTNSSAQFTPVATSYDPAKGTLSFTATSFGDFAFGIPVTVDSAYTPSLLSPRNNSYVNGLTAVKFAWGTKGIVKSYHIQIASDSLFANVLIDNATLPATVFGTTALSNNSAYFWRVNMSNSAGTSNWTTPAKFYTASPFISIVTPNGGEKLYPDSTYIIRWASNIADTVNISLINANNTVTVIADSVFSGTHAIAWQIPAKFAADTSYKLVITDIRNSSLSSTSSAVFSIGTMPTAIKSTAPKSKDFTLYQNYPNPFNPSTVIRYAIPNDGQVNIDVFNVIGQKVASLENSVKKAGEYSLQWNAANMPSGLYFYKITAIGASGAKFTMTRKMLLVK